MGLRRARYTRAEAPLKLDTLRYNKSEKLYKLGLVLSSSISKIIIHIQNTMPLNALLNMQILRIVFPFQPT